MGKRDRLLIYVVIIMGVIAPALWAETTQWINPSGAGLWTDASSWSNGVPTGTSDISLGITPYGVNTVSLGGALHSALSISAGAGIERTFRFSDGTLDVPRIDALSSIEIATNLTSATGRIELIEHGGPLVVSGSIFGSINATLAGIMTAPNTFSGSTTIAGGSLILRDSGSLVNTSLVTIRSSDVYLTRPGRPFPAATPVHLQDATIRADVFSDSSVQLGPVSLLGGTSNVYGVAHLVATSLDRNPGALLVCSIAGFKLTASPPLVGDANSTTGLPVASWGLGYDTGSTLAFLTYDSNGFRPLGPMTEYTSSLLSGANVYLNQGSLVQASNITVNSLTLKGTALTLEAGAAVSIASGGIIFNPQDRSPSLINGSGFLELPAEGDIYAFRPASYRPSDPPHQIDLPIPGGLLVKAGAAALLLSRENAFVGGTIIREGQLIAGAPGALGAGDVLMDGGSLRIAAPNARWDNRLRFDGKLVLLDLPAGVTEFSKSPLGTGYVAINSPHGILRISGDSDSQSDYLIKLTSTTLWVDGNLTSRNIGIITSDYPPYGPSGLNGNGLFRGNANLFNTLVSPGSPGAGFGRLTLGRALLYGGAVLHVDMGGIQAGSQYDQLVVLDGLELSKIDKASILEVALTPGFTPHLGDSFTIIDDRFDGPVAGFFSASSLLEGTIFESSGAKFQISYSGGDGNDVTLTVVPEPGLLITAPLLLLTRRKR